MASAGRGRPRSGSPPPPDIASTEDLRASLLAADEIHFPDPALATALRPLPDGATAMAALAASTARNPIGCTQITEIVVTPG